MAGISSPGIGSGLDVASIVNQLVAAERAPTAGRIDRTERQVNAQISALGNLRSSLDGLQSAVKAVSAKDASQARKVQVDSNAGFKAAATAGAPLGNYQVEVLSLASAQKLSSAAFADPQAVVGTGTLSITAGDTVFDIEITSENNTLAGIRDAINKAADGKGVSATIVNADDGAHLVFNARDPGTTNAVQITTAGGDGGLAALTNAQLTELSAATDAVVRVDGLERTSSSNTITDMLQGVTLTLTKAEPGTTQELKVDGDPSVLRNAAKTLVSAYNSVLGSIASATKYDPTTKVAAALNGDAMVRGIQSDLRNLISADVSDLKTMGITIDKEGKLTLDAAVFDKAIAEDAGPANRLFSAEDGLASNLQTSMSRLLGAGGAIKDGLLTERSDGLKGRTDGIADQRLALDRRMDQIEARYRAQFASLDVMISQMQSTSSYLAQQLAQL